MAFPHRNPVEKEKSVELTASGVGFLFKVDNNADPGDTRIAHAHLEGKVDVRECSGNHVIKNFSSSILKRTA